MKSSKALDKENQVAGIRKPREAPDFSKLHKKWDQKLQRGKAVSKKPLTQSQPFQLTQSKTSDSFVSDKDFTINERSTSKILNGTSSSPQIVSSKPSRATIAGIVRSSTLQKSSIPVPQRRGSSYIKRNTSTPSKPATSNAVAKSIIPAEIKKKDFFQRESRNATQTSFTQDFKVDFKCDPNSLKNILNCDAIPDESITSRQSSQFGPERNISKVKRGRIHPFVKANPNSRFSFQANSVTSSVAEPKRKFSIYSRDSFSTKPELMSWFKKLNEESKAKKGSILPTRPEPVATEENNRFSFSVKSTHLAERPSFMAPNDGLIKSKLNNSATTKFSSTVVGFQGSLDNVEESSKSPYTTPDKIKSISSLHNDDSQLRSILKKNNTSRDVTQPNRDTTQTSLSFSKRTESAKKQTPHALKVGTPIRLSAYARERVKLGLKVEPKYRYEHGIESLTSPSHFTKEDKTPNKNILPKHPVQKKSSVIKTTIPKKDSVLNTGLNESAPASESRDADPKFSSYVSPPPNFERCEKPSTTTKRVRWADVNTSTPSMFSHHASLENNIPVQHQSHKIKFVFPAEQPLENNHHKNSDNQLDVFNQESSIPVKPKQESWATILATEIQSTSNNETLNTKQETLKTRSQNITKLNILDNSIALKSNFSPQPKKDKSNITPNSPALRPYPQIDSKVIKDLISFKDIEEEEEALRQSMLANPRKQKSIIEQPCSSIQGLIETPSAKDISMSNQLVFEEELDDLDESPVNRTETEMMLAPNRKNTRARTPYKEEKFEMFLKILSEAKQKQNVNSNLNNENENKEFDKLNNAVLDDGTKPNDNNNTYLDELTKSYLNSFNQTNLSNSFANVKKKALFPQQNNDVKNNDFDLIGINDSTSCSLPPAKLKNENVDADSLSKVDGHNGRNKDILSYQTNVSNNPATLFQQPSDVVNESRMILQEKSSSILKETIITMPSRNEITSRFQSVLPSFSHDIANIKSPGMNKFTGELEKTVFSRNSKQLLNDYQAGSLLKPSSLLNTLEAPIRLENQHRPNNVFGSKTLSFVPQITDQKTDRMLSFSQNTDHRSDLLSVSQKVDQRENQIPYFSQYAEQKAHQITRNNDQKIEQISYFSQNNDHSKSDEANQSDIVKNNNFDVSSVSDISKSSSEFQRVSKHVKNQTERLKEVKNPENAVNKNMILKPSSLQTFSRVIENKETSENKLFSAPPSTSVVKDKVMVPQTVSFYNPMKNVFPDAVNISADVSMMDDSSFIHDPDDSDICVVISKLSTNNPTNGSSATFSPVVKASKSLPQQDVKRPNIPKSDAPTGLSMGTKSAFKRLPATYNVFPKTLSATTSANANISKEMLYLKSLTNPSIDSVRDAEVSLMCKFAEISAQFNPASGKMRSGAMNPLARLLSEGDAQHFIPIRNER